jgi:hypothetical protein
MNREIWGLFRKQNGPQTRRRQLRSDSPAPHSSGAAGGGGHLSFGILNGNHILLFSLSATPFFL